MAFSNRLVRAAAFAVMSGGFFAGSSAVMAGADDALRLERQDAAPAPDAAQSAIEKAVQASIDGTPNTRNASQNPFSARNNVDRVAFTIPATRPTAVPATTHHRPPPVRRATNAPAAETMKTNSR